MELDGVAGRLDRLGTQVGDAGDRATGTDPGPGAFAADGPGALFALGHTLYGQWSGTLATGGQEARGYGQRLAELATALRQAADGYREAEHGAVQRHRPGT